MENTFSVLYGVLSSFQKYFMCSARVWKRPFLGNFSHVFIFFKQEFICSAPSLQLQKEKERFWVNICSIFFSARIYLFSNRHLQPSYTMIKSVLGVGTFFLVLWFWFWKRAYLGTYLSENSGLFRFVSKQFWLFRLFRYRFETLKQPKKIIFWFHETNRNKRETDLVSVCFGSNRKNILFVSRTPYSRCFVCFRPRPVLLFRYPQPRGKFSPQLSPSKMAMRVPGASLPLRLEGG